MAGRNRPENDALREPLLPSLPATGQEVEVHEVAETRWSESTEEAAPSVPPRLSTTKISSIIRVSSTAEERMKHLWTSGQGAEGDVNGSGSVGLVRHPFEFPGWGGTVQEMDFTCMDMSGSYMAFVSDEKARERDVQLGALPATAICGCDLMASVFYTTALVAAKAGKLAPLCMLCVVFVLYLFRFIYAEAVCALPLNGGSYNVLLNATSKGTAAMCACLSILSYLATGVVSAISAVSYLQTVWEDVDVQWGAIVLLFGFAVLVFMGLSESANVASAIFVTHMLVLTLLLVLGLPFALSEGQRRQFMENVRSPLPTVNIVDSWQKGTVFTALFYGFSSSMLGVTGFETSSNFVEEQAPGVFPLTLRNMWVAVAIYNPLLVLLALFCLPVESMAAHRDSLMAHMAQKMGDWLGPVGSTSWGDVLRYTVAVDAFVVLSGSVLTSYVGMGGLLKRLAMDRCFPAFVLSTNKWRGTSHVIIFGFFIVATSLILILGGDVEALAGVYTMAFLMVMAFFALGTMLLRIKRPDLQREIVCPWWMAIAGLVFVLLAFIGNVMANTDTVPFFILYYIVILALAFAMFQRVRVLKLLVASLHGEVHSRFISWVVKVIRSIHDEPFVFLAKTSDPSVINKALLYVRDNEQTARVLVVHFYDDDAEDPTTIRQEFESSVAVIDKIYPKIMVNCLLVKGKFSPEGIDSLGSAPWLEMNDTCKSLWSDNVAKKCMTSINGMARLAFETGIAKNRMFLACPNLITNFHAYGGVRIITH